MTVNEFRNRHLARNIPGPLSPNPQTRRRRHLPPPLPPLVTANWFYDANFSGHNITVPLHSATFNQTDPRTWDETGTTTQGDAYDAIIVWSLTPLQLSWNLQVFYSGMWNDILLVFDGAYTGATPWDSGIIWSQPWSAVNNIHVQGPLPP